MIEKGLLVAFAVDHKRAQRFAQDLEWVLALQAGRPERKLAKTGRRRAAKSRNDVDPVRRVL